MRRGLGRWPALMCALLLALVAAGCRPADEPLTIYADGTRGCKHAAAPITLWDKPGGVPAGAVAVGSAPHATPLEVLDQGTRFGVRYYLVQCQGVTGWLPENLASDLPPECE